jgi:hypothetical protein
MTDLPRCKYGFAHVEYPCAYCERDEARAEVEDLKVELAQIHAKIAADAFAKGDTQAIRLISEGAKKLQSEVERLREVLKTIRELEYHGHADKRGKIIAICDRNSGGE